MFSRKDIQLFVTSIVLIALGYGGMLIDPVTNGFGILTLSVAPPLLLLGFFLPIIGIIGVDGFKKYIPIKASNSTQKKYAVGFIIFIISFATYFVTLEPTASLWDCAEFIASSYKLQVPHTPGTPLSLLIGKVFTVLALGDHTKIAWSVNVMSAFFSALTAFIVYLLIYYFGEKLVSASAKNTQFVLISSACCGSLCLTFSDTFWFSAVEAETYGIACFFLLLLVWLIVTAKNLSESDRGRRLILIFYIGGLSYCIHPMCLLALALLPFEWLTMHKKAGLTTALLLAIAGLIIVVGINRVVAIGLFQTAFAFDLFLVNKIHLPFYSGAILLSILLVCLFAFLLKKVGRFSIYARAILFLIVGFTPYIMLFIRSGHNPPIDETNPENLAMIKAYMNREGYPSQPLLYGPYFDAKVDAVSAEKKIYYKGTGQYEVAGKLSNYHFEKSRSTILPRMYSNEEDHVRSYRLWTGLQAHDKPSFAHNLKFMFTYQLGHMYLRYLLWNFAGRESDQQNSEWLKPWDEIAKGDQHHEARNQYWMIPLILGVLGLFYQWRKARKDFLSMLIFFLVTGLVLCVYLNSTPNEPRERDYIYIGSYIGWCIWIGLGIIALYNIYPTARLMHFVVGIICISLPAWMHYQNFDDHDRSGRTFQIDNARNILSGCAPHSILFTGGDNDTFPLWYLQEVEEFRTDVRIVVLSYFNTDWYINQLRRRYYQSDAFKLTLDEKNYRQYGLNDVLYVQETIKSGIDIQKFLALLKHEHAGLTVRVSSGDAYNIVPSKTLKLKIPPSLASESSFTAASVSEKTSQELTLHIDGNYIQKNALAFLDLLASNNWNRPIYFNFTSLNTVGLDVRRYVIQEGSLYRLTRFENPTDEIRVDVATSRKNLLEKADYSNLADEEIYFNYEDYHARMISPVRESFNTLAAAYLNKGSKKEAEEVLIYAVKALYPKHLRPSFSNLQAAEMLASMGQKEMAESLCVSLFNFHYDQIQTDLKRQREVERLDLYLADQSASLLYQLGHDGFMNTMRGLDRTLK